MEDRGWEAKDLCEGWCRDGAQAKCWVGETEGGWKANLTVGWWEGRGMTMCGLKVGGEGGGGGGEAKRAHVTLHGSVAAGPLSTVKSVNVALPVSAKERNSGSLWSVKARPRRLHATGLAKCHGRVAGWRWEGGRGAPRCAKKSQFEVRRGWWEGVEWREWERGQEKGKERDGPSASWVSSV